MLNNLNGSLSGSPEVNNHHVNSEKERENLLKLKTLLEEKIGQDQNNTNNNSPVNLVLRASDVADLLSAVSKSLNTQQQQQQGQNQNQQQRRISLGSGGGASVHSPFSAQGHSLTHPFLNGSQQSDQPHNHSGGIISHLQGAKSPEDPFAKVQPFSPAARGSGSSTGNNAAGSVNGGTASQNRRGRTQSVSFAAGGDKQKTNNTNTNQGDDEIENSFRDNNNNNVNVSPFAFGQQQEFSGASVEQFESRFGGLPIASRAAASRDSFMNNAPSLSPFDGNNSNNSNNSGAMTPPTSARSGNGGNGGNGGAPAPAHHQGNSGVKVDALQLDVLSARRKSAVCGVAPHLNLASPRRDADYILRPEDEAALLASCLNAVAELYPGQFAGINDASVMPPLDVNENEFDALSYKETLQREGKIAANGCVAASAESYTYVVVALHVLCKYRFMETFRANPQRLAHFLVHLVNQFVRPSPSAPFGFFTNPVRTAVNVHCIHLILSDHRLGSQLTDIEIAACIVACLAARVGSLGVANEFLFRINHPYARLFPGWSPQEQVSVTIVSELFRDYETTNPFDHGWWMSEEELDFGSNTTNNNNNNNNEGEDDLDLMGGGGNNNKETQQSSSDAARRGVVFLELVADLILTTDTRHQQWLFKECSDALKKAEGAAKGRARRGSIMFGDNSIIRVADMHRILRCLVHLSEQYAYLFQGAFDSFRAWVGRWVLETRSQGAAEQMLSVPITFHCRESTNAAEYHMQFVQIVVVPFAEMLAAALPRAFMVSLFDHTQKLAQLHAQILDDTEGIPQPQLSDNNLRLLSALLQCDIKDAESLRAQALGRFTSNEQSTSLLTKLSENFVNQVLKKQLQLRTNNDNNNDNNNNNISNTSNNNAAGSGSDSAIMQAVMRFIDNKMRVVEMNRQHHHIQQSRELLRNIEVEVVRLVRAGKPELLRPTLRDPNLRDEDIVEALLDNSQTPLGNVFAAKSDAMLALLLRVVRYTKTL